MVSTEPDPVAARRAHIAQLVARAKRVGYSMLLLAMIAFITALVSDFPTWLVTVTIVALIAGIVILPVPIVLGYGVKAAEREERTGHSGH